MKNNKESALKSKVSELRKDIISGDWVVIATGRAKRLDDYKKKARRFSGVRR
jgi:hypothetical protein